MLLQGIDYTGFGVEAGDRTVTFAYEPSLSADRSFSYAAGGLTSQTRRLPAISTHVGSEPVRTIDLQYTPSQFNGRSFLEYATECAYAPGNPTPVCHPSTTFFYPQSEDRWLNAAPAWYSRLKGRRKVQLDSKTIK